MTPNTEAFFLEKHITIANQIAPLHLFLRQIAISLQRVSYFLQRDKQPKGLATRTLTLTFIHTDSCHDSHAFGAYACSFTRARQFCHNVEKYAAETSGPSVNPARGAGWGLISPCARENNSKLTERETILSSVHRLHGNARAGERAAVRESANRAECRLT